MLKVLYVFNCFVDCGFHEWVMLESTRLIVAVQLVGCALFALSGVTLCAGKIYGYMIMMHCWVIWFDSELCTLPTHPLPPMGVGAGGVGVCIMMLVMAWPSCFNGLISPAD